MTNQTKNISSQPTIVISGATGTTGKELVKQLSQIKNINVRAAVHSLEKAKELLPKNIEIVPLDYAQPETVASAFAGADKLYLLPPSDQNHDRSKIAPIMLEAAKQAGIQYIVMISAFGIDLEPILQTEQELYFQVEEMLISSSIAYTILRPSWFNQNFISHAFFGPQVQQGAVHLPVGEGRAGWIDCRDIAAVAAKVLTQTGHENKIYSLTGPESLTTNEIMTILSKVAGKKIQFIDISEEVYADQLRHLGLSDLPLKRLLDIMRKWKVGAHNVITQDVEHVTGKTPIFFQQFAQDYAHVLQQSNFQHV